MPVHIWGEVARPGLHYIPLDTNLVYAVSLAGGPESNAVLDNVKLTRRVGESLQISHFDLEEGGGKEAFNAYLKPGDTVFIERSHFHQNRAYYTGLVSVLATILSTILIYREVKE